MTQTSKLGITRTDQRRLTAHLTGAVRTVFLFVALSMFASGSVLFLLGEERPPLDSGSLVTKRQQHANSTADRAQCQTWYDLLRYSDRQMRKPGAAHR